MEAVKERVRDLEADLAICEAATPWPWAVDDGFLDVISEEIFIAEAREGWPYAIRRAMAAEAENDRLRNELNILQEQLHDKGRCWD